jgi:flagellar hook-basal body complex protein FliE
MSTTTATTEQNAYFHSLLLTLENLLNAIEQAPSLKERLERDGNLKLTTLKRELYTKALTLFNMCQGYTGMLSSGLANSEASVVNHRQSAVQVQSELGREISAFTRQLQEVYRQINKELSSSSSEQNSLAYRADSILYKVVFSLKNSLSSLAEAIDFAAELVLAQ